MNRTWLCHLPRSWHRANRDLLHLLLGQNTKETPWQHGLIYKVVHVILWLKEVIISLLKGMLFIWMSRGFKHRRL